jgi:hypothetical protein
VAQLVARLVRIEKVRGSNPLSSTIFELLKLRSFKAAPSSAVKESVVVAALGSGWALLLFVRTGVGPALSLRWYVTTV